MAQSKSYKADNCRGQDAIEALNSLQSNASVIANTRTNWAATVQYVVPTHVEYLHRIGYQPSDLDALNVVHVAGTKGKGSTCAFASAALHHANPHKKVGLFTSPHLISVRERIRINGQPISEDLFAKYFFDVWDRLHANTERARGERTTLLPAYFRYLTIMAYHVFLSEKVDATILEVGIGGTHDSTNIVPHPLVTGVTALGLDHVAILGKTLPEIASAKAGIYKEGVPALTSTQPEEAMPVLKARAEEVKASSFEIVPSLPEVQELKLGLAGDHQISNASLAYRLCQEFLKASPDFSALDQEHQNQKLLHGLELASWPGRCQVLHKGQVTWFFDGAHTVESLDLAGSWFSSASSSAQKRCLIFNCTSDRTGRELLPSLYEKAPAFDYVLFCPNITLRTGYSPELSSMAASSATDAADALAVQRTLAEIWQSLGHQSNSAPRVLPTIQDTVEACQALAEENQGAPLQVMVTGSLHLVGGVLSIVDAGNSA